MIAIIDYGMGNLRSVEKALEKIGAKAVITQARADIEKADKLVLPGVGAIRPALDRLNELGLIEPVKTAIAGGKPFLGICLGLQLLFQKSDEGGSVAALGLLAGEVRRFTDLKVPHMGWNQIHIRKPACPLWQGVSDGENVYFCHSYFVQPGRPEVIATTTPYGPDFCSSVWTGNVYGVQFHPEKSQDVGLKILKNFAEL